MSGKYEWLKKVLKYLPAIITGTVLLVIICGGYTSGMIGVSQQPRMPQRHYATTTDVTVTVQLIVAPTVTNGAGATLVTYQSARCNGELTDNGNENPTVILYWGTSDGGTTPASWTNNVTLGIKAVGTFYKAISGLLPSTLHYYRYYAFNSGGNDWANSSANFTTLAAPTTTPGGGKAISANVTDTGEGGGELPQLMLLLPVVAAGFLAFKTENAILFYILFGISMTAGLYTPDMAAASDGSTTTMGLSVGLMFIAFAVFCFAMGLRLTFWRGR